MGIKLSFSKGNRATKLQRHQRKHLWRDIRGEKVGEEGSRCKFAPLFLFFFSFLSATVLFSFFMNYSLFPFSSSRLALI